MRQFVRYDFPDETGETRRQRNERFKQPSPEVDYPEEAEHVWDWFWKLSARRRGMDPISYDEIGAWSRLTGTVVRPEEVDMLVSMDDGYLAELKLEHEAAAQRARDRAEAEASNKRRGGRR